MKLMRTNVKKHRETYKYCSVFYLNIKSSGVLINILIYTSCARSS